MLLKCLLITFLFFWTWLLAFMNAKGWMWWVSYAFILVGLHLTTLSGIALYVGWAMVLCIMILVHLKWLRQHLLSKPLMKWMAKNLPSMSQTEREALEAGDSSWEKFLFQGNLKWNDYLKEPFISLTGDENNFLNHQTEHLCSLLNDWEISQEKNLSKKTWQYLKDEKFFGMIIPKEYGGLGFSALAHSDVIIKIATCSLSAAVTVMVPNSLGPSELLMAYGTDAQKKYYLPRLAKGIDIPCFALTSLHAGSDAGAIIDSGIVTQGEFQGKEIIGIVLNFDKRYITLGPVATIMGLAFKLCDPNHLLGDKTDLGITVCLLPTNHPGVNNKMRHSPLNLAFMNGPIKGQDVFIPLDWIIGGKDKVGQGWKMLMECLSAGRGISLPGLSCAAACKATLATSSYAMIREQFSLPIAQFEGIEEAIARIAGFTYSIEATRLLTANIIAQHLHPGVASAITKYHTTEMARKIVNDAFDVHAGKAIMQGPQNYLANAYFGIPIGITVEGANILTRSLIIFGQGAIRSHPFIRQEMILANSVESKANVSEFDNVITQHIRYILNKVAYVVGFGITQGKLSLFSVKTSNPIKKRIRQIHYFSQALAFNAEFSLLILGGDLKRREKISARLGDILSHLYMSAACVKYYQVQQLTHTDEPIVCWAIDYHLQQIGMAFDEFFKNFPSRIFGKIGKWLSFPWGNFYPSPSDQLGHKAAELISHPSRMRTLLTQLCYVNPNEQDAMHRLVSAYEKWHQLQPVFKKLFSQLKQHKISKKLKFSQQLLKAKALNLMDEEELSALLEFDTLREKVMMVDAFSMPQPQEMNP